MTKLIDKSEAFPDRYIGIRLNDRHVVCYVCKWESEPHKTMRAAEEAMAAHTQHSDQEIADFKATVNA